MPEAQIYEIEITTGASRNKAVPAKHRFLKGPIPMSELWAAARQPGQALAVYLAVRHQCDLTRKDTVTLPKALLERFGVDKDSKSRAIRALSVAGLIKIEQKRGRSARITLLSGSPSHLEGERHDA
ncbi:hypothetical protein ACVWYQ_004712 [Bradyrhizobium sp. USDA 3397]